MKRIKHRVFKRHIDLVRYAIKRVTERQMTELKARREAALEHLKKTNWLEWAKYQSGVSVK